jgi:hypothetical protein
MRTRKQVTDVGITGGGGGAPRADGVLNSDMPEPILHEDHPGPSVEQRHCERVARQRLVYVRHRGVFDTQMAIGQALAVHSWHISPKAWKRLARRIIRRDCAGQRRL